MNDGLRRVSEERPTILIVDDEDDIRNLVKVALQDEAKRILEADSGEVAIEAIYKHHPDVVILDYMMPRMDGQAVARCIELLSPQSRVILFTGYLAVPPEWALRCSAYVQKTDFDTLPEVVRSAMRAR